MTVVLTTAAGCGDDAPVDRPSPPSPSPVATVTGSPPAATEEFVDVVRARVPDVALDRRDEEIQAIADQACAGLAAGEDADAIVADTRSLGTLDAEATDQATARELIKLAIETTCPEQNGRVDEF